MPFYMDLSRNEAQWEWHVSRRPRSAGRRENASRCEADAPSAVEYNAQSMRAWLRKSWPLLKALLALAILIAIGQQFVRDLRRPELWLRSLHPSWLLLSAILYLLGLGFSALFGTGCLSHWDTPSVPAYRAGTLHRSVGEISSR